MTSLHLLQGLPGIPEGVKSEGVLAVLFMVLLGAALVLAVLYKGPALIAAWRTPGMEKEKERAEREREMAEHERQRTDQALKVLVANTEANERKAAQVAELALRIDRLSVGLHERVGPAISGLSFAFLIISGEQALAEQNEKREEEKGYPPAQKVRGRQSKDGG